MNIKVWMKWLSLACLGLLLATFPAACDPEECGDGKVGETEECDDRNLLSGDGCSAVCKHEFLLGTFENILSAQPNAVYISNELVVNLVEESDEATISLLSGQALLLVDGQEVSAPAMVRHQQRIQLQMKAPAQPNQTISVELALNGESRLWQIRTRNGVFGWLPGTWSACSNSCGEGTRTREVGCWDDQIRRVADGYCTDTAPATQESCTDYSTCNYQYDSWSDWTPCVNGAQMRTRNCIRTEDNTSVDCQLCGGACAETQSCNTCGQFSRQDTYRSGSLCRELFPAFVSSCVQAGCTAQVDDDCRYNADNNNYVSTLICR